MSGHDLIDFLTATRAKNGSDLHLAVGAPPVARINGRLVPLDAPPLDAEFCRSLVMAVLTDPQRATLEKEWELDFSLNVGTLGRFRGNAHFSRGGMECSLRHISDHVPTLEELGHGQTLIEWCKAKGGLVLVTGTSATGKSTTVASMTRRILSDRAGVVVTIDDPIEYLHNHARGIIKQRQIGVDTHGFPEAIRAAVRQDVDVIVVSEMRDQESISAALTAAETGHLVIATLHTRSAAASLSRVVDVFPADQQPQIVTQLAGSLLGIVNQRLLARQDAPGRVLASEILVNTPAVAAVMRDHRFEQIYGIMQVSSVHGMHTMDESLLHLLGGGHILLEDALLVARDPDLLQQSFQAMLRANSRKK